MANDLADGACLLIYSLLSPFPSVLPTQPSIFVLMILCAHFVFLTQVLNTLTPCVSFLRWSWSKTERLANTGIPAPLPPSTSILASLPRSPGHFVFTFQDWTQGLMQAGPSAMEAPLQHACFWHISFVPFSKSFWLAYKSGSIFFYSVVCFGLVWFHHFVAS